MTETQMIVELIEEIRKEDIPYDIISSIKENILDFLGTTFAGSYALKESLNLYLDMKPKQSQDAVIIGLNRWGTVEDAALLNGIASHFLELDDGSRFGMVHLEAPIFSALFAIAKPYDISANSFIRAALVGYEVTVRLSSAIQTSHKKRGFHATGTCGCIGAAAAVATALKYDAQSLNNTISASVASASGLLEMIEDVSQLKSFNAGKAAQNAIIAAIIGKCHLTGPIDPIGGERGFVHVMADSFNEKWFDREANKYVIGSAYKKPYASCRHCHSAVEAALSICESIDPEQIDNIYVFTYNLAIHGHDHTEVSGAASAKMSIPYSVAAAICLHTGGLESMCEDAIQNKDILKLTKKVHVVENKKFSALVPSKRIAELVVNLKSGRQIRKKVIYPKGEPENPMNKSELIDKFKHLVIYSGRSDIFCSEIINIVDNIENSFSDLLNIITRDT